MHIIGPVFLVCSFVCCVFNIFSLIILLRTIDLRKKQFYCLALYLSISDAVIGFETISFYFINQYTEFTQLPLIITCTILKAFIAGTMIFSLVQVLMICFERLNATLQISNVNLKRITSNKAVGISFIITHLYTFTVPVVEFLQNGNPCDIKSTLLRFLIFDFSVIILTVAIVTIYFLIIVRIVMQNKKMQAFVEPLASKNNSEQDIKESTKRRKKNIITLGFIIIIALTSTMPRFVTSGIALYLGNTAAITKSLEISNHFMLINPLMDPVIYILRIKEYRQRLRCK